MSTLIEKELVENDKAQVWNEFYQRIKNEAALKTLDDDKFTVVAARKPENRNKNRYRDVNPYDHSRIVLEKGDDDYVNASLVEVPKANRRYILAQGPLEHTASNFWQTVWEQESKAIVMLNKVIEKGTIKCHQYWPLGVYQDYEDEMLFEDVELKVTLLQEEDFENYTKRLFNLEDLETGDKREVLHFHYTTWPDFGVPSSPTAFLSFLMAVRETGSLESDYGPAVIHCSAGIGRSGTFCLVDSCLVQIEREGNLKCVDLRSMLIDMRSYRMGLIQTPDQLRFSYIAVIEGGRRLLNLSDANSNLKQLANNESTKEDNPPTPPTRSTSLHTVKQLDEDPELPHDKIKTDMTDNQYGSPSKLRKIQVIEKDDDYERPAKQRKIAEENENNDFVEVSDFNIDKADDDETNELRNLRRRVREDRKKVTADKIKKMKDKQKKSEIWKVRKSYFRPICLGLTLLLGSYFLYRYWSR